MIATSLGILPHLLPGIGVDYFGAVFLGDLHGVEALVECLPELLQELSCFGLYLALGLMVFPCFIINRLLA